MADTLSRLLITVGGIGTIIAVLLVALFLVYVVTPLFRGAKIEDVTQQSTPWTGRAPIEVGTDEYQRIGWALFEDGSIISFAIEDGRQLQELNLVDTTTGPAMTAWANNPGMGSAAFGFANGTARLGRIGFGTTFVEPAQLAPEFLKLEVGKPVTFEQGGRVGLIERTPEGQYRFQFVTVKLDEPVESGSTTPVKRIDYSVSPSASILTLLHEDGTLFVEELRERKNIMTGEVSYRVRKSNVPYEKPDGRGMPDYLLLSGLGDGIYLIWKDGLLERIDVRNISQPRVVEKIDLLPDSEATIADARFLLGKTTVLVGDSQGNTGVWFAARSDQVTTEDGVTLMRSRLIPAPSQSAVQRLGVSQRGRMFAISYSDGNVLLTHATSGKEIAQFQLPGDAQVRFSLMSPKDDGLIVFTDMGLSRWVFQPGHPEATMASMFTPVWYESTSGPSHVWQSTGGTDDFEEKFGLYPLIFGTIKATVYSLMFGVPIALLAAIYTSEFLHPKVKSRIKPTIELMASLPSVVLGFLAGLVFAPFVENIVPAMLAAFLCVPLMFLLGAYLWQLLPHKLVIRIGQFRFIAILAALPVGILAAITIGPMLEDLLFAGNIKLWLNASMDDAKYGSPFGGWFLTLIPVSMVVVALIAGRTINPYLRSISVGWSRKKMALVDMGKAGAILTVSLVITALLAVLMGALGLDVRGELNILSANVSPMGTFVQRNALVVGFTMGFAIIPIIYTIAEDALSTVPEHLRSASLGSGATPWQTATRIVVPTAMSGLFSACMIGLGRAVGETMIVLMAAGNTPVLEMNIFNGFRTLSANIAVELPEAVKDSTHYRTLYLAALVLFVMTFFLNTIAESIRQRFRKRAYQL